MNSKEKKKVLFVINHFRFSDGVAKVLRSLIDNIDYKRFEIHLLPIYGYDEEFARPIIGKFKLLRGFGFYFHGLDKIVGMINTRLLYKILIKEKYDVEISFQYGLPTRLLSVSNNMHRICWMHTFDNEMEQKKYDMKYPLMVTVSKIGRKKLIEKGFSPEKCVYCYNIIDENEILAKASEQLQYKKQHDIVITTVARMDADKGYIRYAKCIKQYIDDEKNNKNVEFWFVGGGSEENTVREYVDENNLNDVIKIFGKQNNPYKYMNASNLYFCASFREGFSTSCQEASLLGIPVVSVNVDGAVELIEDSQCGRVIPNDDTSILKGLEEVLNDNNMLEQWKGISESNRHKFFKANRIKKIENIIDSI